MTEGAYELEVFHARTKPVRQKFTIHGYCLFIDVARFDGNSAGLGFLHNFCRRDFSLLRDTTKSATGAAMAYLREHAAISADHVFLLANPRILGYVFNPVSFFFFYKAGAHVATVVEVNNTFGEQKHFVLSDTGKRVAATKNFYVSPFISPLADFHLNITAPEEKLAIGIHTHGSAGVELVAEMRGKRRPLNRAHLIRLFLKYPLHTLRVIILIHWYALKLLAARVPFFPKATADAAIAHADLRSSR